MYSAPPITSIPASRAVPPFAPPAAVAAPRSREYRFTKRTQPHPFAPGPLVVSIRPSGDAAWEPNGGTGATTAPLFQSAQAATPLGNVSSSARTTSGTRFNPPKRRRRLGTPAPTHSRKLTRFQSAQAATPLGNPGSADVARVRKRFNPPKRRRRLGTIELREMRGKVDVSIRPSGDAAWEPDRGGAGAGENLFQSAQAATPLGNDVVPARRELDRVSIRPSGDAAWELDTFDRLS